MHCINHFFSPTRKEVIKNISIKAHIPSHNSSDTEDTLNISQDGQELESATINDTEASNYTAALLNPDKGTHSEFDQKQVEHVNHEFGTVTYKRTTENDITVITDEKISTESVKDPLMTIETNFRDVKGTDVIQTIQMSCKNGKISQPCDSEVSNERAQTVIVKLNDEKMNDLSRKIVHMSVSIDNIKQKIEQHKNRINRDKRQVSVKFRAEIDPTKNQSAELELRKEISQDMFAKVSKNIHTITGF